MMKLISAVGLTAGLLITSSLLTQAQDLSGDTDSNYVDRTGLTQAQEANVVVNEVESQAEELTGYQPLFVDPNQIFIKSCRVGPNPRNLPLTINCANIGFTSASPRIVLCQTRNAPNDPVSHPDQFACQVIKTTNEFGGSVQLQIRRIDKGTGPSGWGQNLYLNLLVVN